MGIDAIVPPETLKVDILGVTFEVCEVECVNKAEARLGEIDFLEQKIRIQKDLPSDRKREVLMHEIFHGVAEATGYDDILDEKAVQVLARSIYNLFKTNPAISSWLVFGKEQNPQLF